MAKKIFLICLNLHWDRGKEDQGLVREMDDWDLR